MKKAILGALFAGAMLASCSSDEPLVNGGEDNKTEGNLGYVAVNIVQPASVGSRAEDTPADDTFENGTPEENTAQYGLFFILDASNNIINRQSVSLTGAGTGDPHVERVYNAVLVIDGVTNDSISKAKSLVCVLNAPDDLESDQSITNLTQLKAKFANYGEHADNKFIMTNSVYNDASNNEVLAATIAAENIKTSAQEARENAVDIYVERIVAKIRTKAENFTNSGAKIPWSGTDAVNDSLSLKIKITGIEIANIAQKSYLFKNISGITETWNWSNPTNKRSYWEITKAPTGSTQTYGNMSYNQIATSPDNFNIKSPLTEYVQPNTDSLKTAVLVTAQLLKQDNSVMDSLVYIRGGYTTINGAKNLVASFVATKKYWKEVSYAEGTETKTKYVQLSADDFEWNDSVSGVTTLKRHEVLAQVKSTITGLKKFVGVSDANPTGYTNATVSEINTLLSTGDGLKYKARVYTDGKCYYFVNIDQKGVVSSLTISKPGVVRNHIYDLTLNSIKGIGVPVFDPNDVIIPEETDDEQLYYLAAQINVLAWKIVSQTVDFGK